jgi:hypothetical protein
MGPFLDRTVQKRISYLLLDVHRRSQMIRNLCSFNQHIKYQIMLIGFGILSFHFPESELLIKNDFILQSSSTMRLNGITALVAGATGEVGRGAAYALSKEGAEVWLLGRNVEKLKTVQSSLPHTSHVWVADYSTAQGTQELQKLVQDKTFDVVVAASGPWWPINHLAKANPSVIQDAIAANFQSQVNLFSTLASKTKRHYIMVNGTAAKAIPNTGFTGVLANAVAGLAQMAFHECQASPTTMPQFTHAQISSSVGHDHVRGQTHDPNEFGKVFVAMVLNQHEGKARDGTLLIDDAFYQKIADSM